MQTRAGPRSASPASSCRTSPPTASIYGEIRWAPEQHLTRGLSLDEAVEAVQEGIEQGIDDVRHQGARIRVGQLVTAMRHADRGLEIAELAVRHRDRGVVGFDIAGAEAGLPRRAATAPPSTSSPRSSSRSPCTPARPTGSTPSAAPSSTAAPCASATACASPRTSRSSAQDDENTYVSLGPIAQWVRDREIALETSPSSNLQTGAIAAWGDELVDHPFDLLYQLGFRVTVNTDNRLQSGTSLTRELVAAQRRVRLRPRRLRDVPAQRRGSRLPAPRRPRGARRAHPGRLRRSLTGAARPLRPDAPPNGPHDDDPAASRYRRGPRRARRRLARRRARGRARADPLRRDPLGVRRAHDRA